ncbi:hypothetical protein [Pseudomonas nitroreducens]|uniref:hypothetical protein n=1 Tax=Pseudomonas nitroreducens TaxID=46680 RepID=UPI00351DA395
MNSSLQQTTEAPLPTQIATLLALQAGIENGKSLSESINWLTASHPEFSWGSSQDAGETSLADVLSNSGMFGGDVKLIFSVMRFDLRNTTRQFDAAIEFLKIQNQSAEK